MPQAHCEEQIYIPIYPLPTSHVWHEWKQHVEVLHISHTGFYSLGDMDATFRMQFTILFYWFLPSDLLMIMPMNAIELYWW